MNEIPKTTQCTCGATAQLVTKDETFYHRKTGNSVDVIRHYYECPQCVDPFDGTTPFRFVSDQLATIDTQALDAAWLAKYGTPYFTPKERPLIKREVRRE